MLSKDWRNLYEASVHSLQSDDDDETNPVMQQPFYLNHQPSIENPMSKIKTLLFVLFLFQL